MKTGQSSAGSLTWSRISEISRKANSVSTLLPDMGRCTKTRLAQVDSVQATSRVQGSSGAMRGMGHEATAGGNSIPYFAK